MLNIYYSIDPIAKEYEYKVQDMKSYQILLNKKYTNKSEFENDFEIVKKTFPNATLVEFAY